MPIITKVLAAEEDLLLGIGQAQQTRAGQVVQVTAITINKVIYEASQLDSLDPDKYPMVTLLDSASSTASLYMFNGTEYTKFTWV